MSARLSRLTIGALALTPAFDADVAEYAATTTNATNTVTAVAEDVSAEVSIYNGDTRIGSGTAAAWAGGENILRIDVANGEAQRTYTVTVTRGE